jgi:hypothetical protein
MSLLTQFLLRLTFGLAVAIGATSPTKVASGFFRNHLYVTLGLSTMAALVATKVLTPIAWMAGIAAVISYAGAICFLYEAKWLGRRLIWAVAFWTILPAWIVAGIRYESTTNEKFVLTSLEAIHSWSMLSVTASGIVLGFTFGAMLLGHWYLNSPGMELAPLRRLLVLAGVAVGLQMMVSGYGLVHVLLDGQQPPVSWWLFIVLRWSFGLIGVLGLIWMAWQTLKIPNTQSATGILYVAVIGVFVGELTGLLLSAESAFPL